MEQPGAQLQVRLKLRHRGHKTERRTDAPQVPVSGLKTSRWFFAAAFASRLSEDTKTRGPVYWSTSMPSLAMSRSPRAEKQDELHQHRLKGILLPDPEQTPAHLFLALLD